MDQTLGRAETSLSSGLLCLYTQGYSPRVKGQKSYRYAETYGQRHPGIDGQARQKCT